MKSIPRDSVALTEQYIQEDLESEFDGKKEAAKYP